MVRALHALHVLRALYAPQALYVLHALHTLRVLPVLHTPCARAKCTVHFVPAGHELPASCVRACGAYTGHALPRVCTCEDMHGQRPASQLCSYM